MKTLLRPMAVCLALFCSFVLTAGAAMAAGEICCRIGTMGNLNYVWLTPVDCAEAKGTAVAESYCPKPPASGGPKIKKKVAADSLKYKNMRCCLEPGKKPFLRPLAFGCKGMYVPKNYCVG
jgi:hypothetical protein